MRVYSVLAITIVFVVSFCSVPISTNTKFCLKQLNWDQERLNSVLEDGYSTDVGCWFACRFQQIGKITGNKFNASFHKQIWDIENFILKLEHDCTPEANEKEDECDVVLAHEQCIQGQMVELTKKMVDS